jgi:carotenoid cleavage dioxygenase-like enzyme
VVRRDDRGAAVRWFTIDPCSVFHTLNAYDTGNRTVLHVVGHRDMCKCYYRCHDVFHCGQFGGAEAVTATDDPEI